MVIALDREITQKVMGLSHNEAYGILAINMPEYSTRIKDAWFILERMQDLGWDYVIHNLAFEYSCEFKKDDRCTTATEKTVPITICNAALNALALESVF